MARYIDVDDLNNNFRGELCNHIHCENCSFHKGAYYCNLAEYLLKYEPADVVPVIHALWEAIPMRYEDDDPYQLFKCSHCEYETHTLTNYCPYCGASMEVE